MITLARFAHRRPRLIVAFWLAVIGLGAVLAVLLPGAPKPGGSDDPRGTSPAVQKTSPDGTDRQESVVIHATGRDVREVLLQVAQLDRWNPAFLSITGSPTARIGQPHPIRVRGGLSGYFQYDLIDPDRIESSWRVPGFRETNHWQLRPAAGHTTIVTHGLAQSGPLAALVPRTTGGVAELRLARLKGRVEARVESGAETDRQSLDAPRSEVTPPRG